MLRGKGTNVQVSIQSAQNQTKYIILCRYFKCKNFDSSLRRGASSHINSLKCSVSRICINLFAPRNLGQGTTSQQTTQIAIQQRQQSNLAMNSKAATPTFPTVMASMKNWEFEVEREQAIKARARAVQMIEFSQVKPKLSSCWSERSPARVISRRQGQARTNTVLIMKYVLIKQEALPSIIAYYNPTYYQFISKLILSSTVQIKLLEQKNQRRVASSTVLSKAILYFMFISWSLSSVTFRRRLSLLSEPPTRIVDSWNSRSKVLLSLYLFRVILPEFDTTTFFFGVTKSLLQFSFSFSFSFSLPSLLPSCISSTLIANLKISFSVP